MISDLHKSAALCDLAYAMRQAFAYHVFHSSAAPDILAENLTDVSLVHNAILESSLAFFRRLNEFFGGKREISAKSFTGSAHEKWLLDIKDKKLIDDCIMHFTLTEARQGRINWDLFFKKYLSDVIQHYRRFVKDVSEESLHLITPDVSSAFAKTERIFKIYLPGMKLNQAEFCEDQIGKRSEFER